jgi:hypothetical protein
MRGFVNAYLDETNVGGLLTEALTADVQAVLADETSGVGADAAVEKMERQPDVLFFDCDPLARVRARHQYIPPLSLKCCSSKRRGP